ncbi:MAG: HAD-IIB family hydrolase [Deltaproteobacteria bacterium]|nr:MAG: HAD-IIB family hydrolase [Deltaproteobacteria bacterium]
MKPQPIIFTDLDGTLLEHQTYSFTAALPALELVKKRGIPLTFCSSKTGAEIEYWREKIGNHCPFISENGGGIFIPQSYFAADELDSVWEKTKKNGEYFVLILGTTYHRLCQALEELRRDGIEVNGFGDMNVAEVAEIAGLSLEEAEMAKRRDFDEPFTFSGDQARVRTLLAAIEEKGLRSTVGGRFYHLMGDNDKGKAVDILKKLYQKKFGDIVTIAFGDSPNDLPMLERVDYPILVQNYKGEHDQRITIPNLIRAEGIGPEGWNRAMLKFMQDKHL